MGRDFANGNKCAGSSGPLWSSLGRVDYIPGYVQIDKVAQLK